MQHKADTKQAIRRIRYFFPLQLLVLHVKKSHLLLLVWILLFGYITENLGVKYGIPYLFLYPEYFEEVSFWSFLIVGFSLGGFITAFNLYSYTMHAHRFPFIATIARPFLKFNINNAIIPGLFTATYLYCSAHVQMERELVPGAQVAFHLAGFVLGMLIFLALALLYFTRTNTDVIKLLGAEPEYPEPETMTDLPSPGGRNKKHKQLRSSRWFKRDESSRKWRVETYLTPRLRLALARSSAHYDRDLLRSVLWQNHINGSIFEVVLILSFVALGAFSDLPLFEIPAAASAFLLFTMLLMLFSALFSWFKGWTTTVLIVFVVGLNLLSHHSERLFADNHAYGLDYGALPATYDQPTITAMALDSAAARTDRDRMLRTLELWLQKNQPLVPPGEKPPMVIVNTSGGGLRALLWTYRCLQYGDSVLSGGLMDRTTLMTGSSGGLIGAAFYRQLFLEQMRGNDLRAHDPSLFNDLSSDMLNAVAFSFVTNDMFVRYRRVSDGRFIYTKDRGHAFERRLNEKTHGLLDLRLSDLARPEAEAKVPLLVMSPTSINDGRRLVISAQPVAFLTDISAGPRLIHDPQPESIEFSRLFADHSPMELKLTSALRMSATFPYVTPVVTLPSEPPLRAMDAGIRDNYGYRITLAYLLHFREWIAEHTSGVIIVQMRDKQKETPVRPMSGSLIGRLFDPVGSVYDNFLRIQDQDYDLMMQHAGAWADLPIEVVELQLRHDDDDEISLSWHLTAVERSRVLAAVGSPENQRSFRRLQDLLKGREPIHSTTLVSHDSGQAPEGDPAPLQ